MCVHCPIIIWNIYQEIPLSAGPYFCSRRKQNAVWQEFQLQNPSAENKLAKVDPTTSSINPSTRRVESVHWRLWVHVSECRCLDFVLKTLIGLFKDFNFLLMHSICTVYFNLFIPCTFQLNVRLCMSREVLKIQKQMNMVCFM